MFKISLYKIYRFHLQNQRFICSKLACIKYIVSIFRQNIKVIFCTKIPLRKASNIAKFKFKEQVQLL